MYSLPLTQDEFQRSGYRDLIACKAQTKPVCLQVDSSLLRLVTSTDTQHSFRVVSRRSRVAAALVGLRRKNYLEVPSTSGRLPICTTVGKKEKKEKNVGIASRCACGRTNEGAVDERCDGGEEELLRGGACRNSSRARSPLALSCCARASLLLPAFNQERPAPSGPPLTQHLPVSLGRLHPRCALQEWDGTRGDIYKEWTFTPKKIASAFFFLIVIPGAILGVATSQQHVRRPSLHSTRCASPRLGRACTF